MLLTIMDRLNPITSCEGGIIMEDTKKFVDQLQEKQAKDEQNRKRQGHGHPEKKLPNKQH